MASLAANRALRASTAGSSPAIHLGSFSRMDIADFDSRGRYPTTPSPQDVRSVPVISPAWAPIDPNAPQNAYANQENMSGDRFQQGGPSGLSNGAGPYDNASMPRSTGDDAQRKNSGDSAGSNTMPMGPAPGTPSQRPYVDASLQDPARASLPPGPRHPQAPSRASTISQNAQVTPQGGRSTGQYPYTPATTVTPTPGNQPQQSRQPDADPYNKPMSGAYGATTLQVQNAPRAQMPPPPEEVCIECMMRDRDMADVIVTGPGIWDRDSDVHLRELLEREDQEEMAWRERHAAELAVPGNKLRPPRRASKGHRLTEQNLKIWLTLNPKEAHARLMTIDAYVKQQAQLLVEEAEARAKAQQDAQRFDARVRDNYSQGRHSTYEPSSTGVASEDSASGVRIPPPRSSMYEALPAGQKRDTIVLDNGMIVERLNLKREEKERQKKARKASQATDISTLSPGGYASPVTPTPNGMDSDFEPSHGNMSATSLSGLRPKSAPLGVPLTKYASHASMDGKGHRFMGSKHWQAPWNSGASVAPSGSMMDMHVALDQEYDQQMEQFGAPPRLSNQHAMSSFSLPASPRNQSRPHTADAMMHSRRSTSPDPRAKKSSGFGKLWKMVRSKKSESKHQSSSVINYAREEDMSTPLPPPRMPYAASQRSAIPPHTRQASGPGSQYLPSPSHPRSISQSGGAISPTTAPSSSLPSPTSNRFPWRESTGDERRQSVYAKDVNGDAETLQGGNQMESSAQPGQYPEMNMQRPHTTGGSASSEYGRLLPPNNNGAPARSPAPSTAILSSSAHSPRPLSSIHKPLPLPPGSPDTSARHTSMSFQGGANYAGGRPSTVVVSGEDMYAPPVPFREDGYDARRQSFSGALPPGAAQTLQPKRSIPAIAYNSGAQYADFGGQVDNYGLTPYSNGALSDTSTKTKRRSRFLPFLSKKEKEKVPFAPQQLNGGFEGYEPAPLAPPTRPAFGHSQRSQSSVSLNTPDYAANHLGPQQQQLGYNDRARPMSGYSTFTNGQRPNKALIDQVVPRDNDFLAYRYPSIEQPSDVSRR